MISPSAKYAPLALVFSATVVFDSTKTFSNTQFSEIVTPSLTIEEVISTFAPIFTLFPMAVPPVIFALADIFQFSPTMKSRFPT